MATKYATKWNKRIVSVSLCFPLLFKFRLVLLLLLILIFSFALCASRIVIPEILQGC